MPKTKHVEQPLPDGIRDTDLTYPSLRSKDRVVDSFELWYVPAMGWVIPTLLIRRSQRSDRTNRTYATTLDGKPCRVGLGPHVTRQVFVRVRESRKQSLQKFLDLKLSGEQTSNEIRDRISTRRAQTEARRMRNNALDWLR